MSYAPDLEFLERLLYASGPSGFEEAAEREGLPYTLHAHGRWSGTDADEVAKVREGIPTGIVSIPLRYMHSPVEMVDLKDVKRAVGLLAAFVAGV
ncbi:hypothetical protein [Thermus scotoductus]|jgi:endoglucanase|uniref:hypothetical protein n=1 Tax=Thermus scotoductus TaxID=37636 RepID=UPI001F017FCA|nr:hypothetical protein [Thermus scotoductus]